MAPPVDDSPAVPAVAAVTVKLPTFWPKRAEIWFAQAEAQFTLKNITVDLTKYSYVVAALDEETAGRVLSLIRTPPDNNKYTSLKTRLVGAFKLTEQECAARILDTNGLGDDKPSALMDKMLALIPEGKQPGFLFREVFLRQLPGDVRSHLAHTDYPELSDLAKAADRHFLSTGAAINATFSARAASSSQLTKAKVHKPTGDSGEVSTGACYYHQRFGAQASNCRPPCSFPASGNSQAGGH
jgi:hypothetical protein